MNIDGPATATESDLRLVTLAEAAAYLSIVAVLSTGCSVAGSFRRSTLDDRVESRSSSFIVSCATACRSQRCVLPSFQLVMLGSRSWAARRAVSTGRVPRLRT